jgi:glycosyltransferase involved in cell wall biosynthesis
MKGVGVLLDAIELLPEPVRRDCAFEVYGGGAHRFGEEFATSLTGHKALRHAEVSLRGEYANERVSDLLDHLDLIVVPSIWWENSPVVIEEALSRGVPVLCSDIGGMAEKVRPGIDGWHFRVGDARSLAQRLIDLVSNRPWAVSPYMRQPQAPDTTAESYVRLYRRLYESEPSETKGSRP